MAENIEIEFKNLLTEQEFNQLRTRFNLCDAQFTSQTNHYFDTEQFSLKSHNSALRIREKNGQYEFTLKQPLQTGEGLLETNQMLTSEQANQALTAGIIPTGEVSDKLQHLIPAQLSLRYFGQLTTVRAETNYQEGLLVLDKSSYLDQTDFELEYEVSDYEEGCNYFDQLLSTEQIPKRQTANKVERFFSKMKERIEQN